MTMMRWRMGCAVLVAALAVVCARGQVAMTPPMGWNSWNHFAERVPDADVRTAQRGA